MGGHGEFEHALATFAAAYADTNEGDHGRLRDAIASGDVDVVEGV
jgi:hypothetical protein